MNAEAVKHPDFRRWIRHYWPHVLIPLLWVLLGLFSASQRAMAGGDDFGPALRLAAADWVPWVILSPVIFLIAEHYPPVNGQRIKSVFISVVTVGLAIYGAETLFRRLNPNPAPPSSTGRPAAAQFGPSGPGGDFGPPPEFGPGFDGPPPPEANGNFLPLGRPGGGRAGGGRALRPGGPGLAGAPPLALEQSGYTVLLAASGAEGLALWQKQAAGIRLLLTDMVMPGGPSGPELARALWRERSSLPVIFMSGYSPDVVGGNLDLREGFNYLPKPFSLQRLIALIDSRLRAVT
jgi:CheY-like chemotaxis protein